MRRYFDRWYSPKQITFTIPQIRWLLRHWGIIKAGQWPPEPIVTGYFDLPFVRRSKRRRWAGFETAAEVWAELDQRMILAGEDGSLLRDVYIIGLTYEQAAMYHRCSRMTISRHLQRAFEKIKGKQRIVTQTTKPAPLDK